MDRDTFIRSFSLNPPVDYHSESLERMRHIDQATLRKAAVLIGCVERAGGLNVILTKRANHLKHHPGQISFPGGKFEEQDRSLVRTAIREAHEEIGLAPQKIHLLGQLPQLMTFSRFMVTPVIAMVESDYSTIIDENEVDAVFEVPADHLFDTRQLYSQLFRFESYSHRVFAIPYGEHFIWGVTAQIIEALQQQLTTK